MNYLYPLNKLKICFQSESHESITQSKQSRKFFVSPVKFTKVHVSGFVNEQRHAHGSNMVSLKCHLFIYYAARREHIYCVNKQKCKLYILFEMLIFEMILVFKLAGYLD